MDINGVLWRQAAVQITLNVKHTQPLRLPPLIYGRLMPLWPRLSAAAVTSSQELDQLLRMYPDVE